MGHVSGWHIKRVDTLLFGVRMGIVGEEVIHVARVGSGLPVDTVRVDILDVLLWRVEQMFQPTRAISEEAEEVHLSRTCGTLTPNVHGVVVPGVDELLGVLVNCVEEEVVEKPDVGGDPRIKSAVGLEINEEVFPLGTVAAGNVEPQSLNTGVVDAPNEYLTQREIA